MISHKFQQFGHPTKAEGIEPCPMPSVFTDIIAIRMTLALFGYWQGRRESNSHCPIMHLRSRNPRQYAPISIPRIKASAISFNSCPIKIGQHTKWSLRISTFRGFQSCSSPHLCDTRDLNPDFPFVRGRANQITPVCQMQTVYLLFIIIFLRHCSCFFPKGISNLFPYFGFSLKRCGHTLSI